ncbi:right-handed parallel beta-helix repeat-containing protein [Synechococcus sp. CBW1108]|uniref:right-handed parallel beta-helix repeat-containing protein n=1 Tax=Synechococcus sp. CBW1108 TaxID=1353147 RepID=UPI0018CD3047|nr:right-handed parallel beta-helix repeat-containing protein [Synechococcus sp. CBW1108]QPN69237.1 right-handed parallel beta-helix repeat-containing protein [Synechococcus sp. CBW1108]
MRFQSQGAGTFNTLSGYIYAPLSQSKDGNVLFVDGFANWNFGGDLNDSNFGASTRLGYRWMSSGKDWMFGVNAGADTTPYEGDYNWQAGVGLEALNKNVELRANGYIPLSDSNKEVGRGYSGAYLSNNSLYLKNTYQDWITSYGGLDLEVGTPVARWDQGGLWLYAGYYYLDATVADGPDSSGFSARAEARIADNFAVGATYSYDDIFESKATGYIRYGTQPLNGDAGAEISRAERALLAQRGLPVEREIDVRISQVRINKGTQKADNPDTNEDWVIRCVGSNASGNDCDYTSLTAAVNAGNSDVILVADGNATDLGGSSLAIPKSAVLSNGRNAPDLDTQYGTADLREIYGAGSVNRTPTISNGTLTVASDSAIEGFSFTNASITNRSTSNVSIRNNTFTGSVDGEGAIVFDGANDVVIAGNTITNPTTSALEGDANGSLIGRGIAVKNGNNIRITGNTVKGATGEGIYIENIGTNRNNTVSNNTVSDMRVDVDTNLEAGIFVRNNKDGYIAITGNTVKDNNQESGVGAPTSRGLSGQNAADGIELNICRGGVNIQTSKDGGTDDRFSDDLAGACTSNATLTAVVNNNVVTNLQGSADGIDTNVGDNGTLNLTVKGNTVTGAGDEAFTLDVFGAKTAVTAVISDNVFKTSGAKGARTDANGAYDEDGSTDGIAITLTELPATDYTPDGDYDFTIAGNTIVVDTDNLAGTNEKPEKAEGIKFTVAEGQLKGKMKLKAVIDNNTITTRSGDGIEFAINEDAKGMQVDLDATVTSNTITQTNDALQAGVADTGDVKDAIKFEFSTGGSADATEKTTGTILIDNNTIIQKEGNGALGDAVDIKNDGVDANAEIKVTVKNQVQDSKVKITRVNDQILADTVTNLVIKDNTITNPELSLLEGSSVESYIGRGIDVRNSNKVTIEDNVITGATGEGIYIENIGTSTDNIITGNTVSGMKASEDSNLEAGIFVRNNKDGYIAITGNTVKDNNLTSGVGFPADRGTNATDGIEVNICRGGENLGSDAFTDGVAGACDSNATLTAVIDQNTVSNLQGGADGIDANIGDNGRLFLTVDQNTVTGAGDEGFTLDAFGANTQATVSITNNTLKTSGAKGAAPGEDGSTDGIAITLQENVSDTDFTASGVYNFTITGNTIEADTDNLAGTNESGEKAEGIKFTINEGLKNGTTKVTAVIENNDIQTRIGDGIEFAVNEKAGEGVVFDADITINNNRIVQTNDNPVGSDNKDPRDLIKATFGEEAEAEGSITTGTFTITNNTVTSAAEAGDAIDYQSLSKSTSNSFKFKIEGNDFSAAGDKDLKIIVPAGFLGIFAPDGTTDFDTYLDSVNTGAEASVDSPAVEVFRF